MTQEQESRPPRLQQHPMADKLVQLVEIEIASEAKRIADQKPATVEQLQIEIARTALSMLRDLGIGVLQFRNWAAYSHSQHSDHLDDHESRLSVLESIIIGGETQLAPEDADLFAKVVAATEAIAENALATTTDQSGRAKLEELLSLCKLAMQRIEETTISTDDDDDGDGSDEEDDETTTSE